MGGKLPEFLEVGVQKGGATTLQRLLEQHPGTFLPAAKELHYFSLHYALGEGWYREQFAEAGAMASSPWSWRRPWRLNRGSRSRNTRNISWQ